MVKRYVPGRGDLVWLNFTPRAGHEQAGHRPALVLSPAPYNDKTGLMLCCPITSQVKGYPFEVRLPEGFRVKGAILADQVKCHQKIPRLRCAITPQRAPPGQYYYASEMRENRGSA